MNIISYLINYDYIYPLAWEDPRVDNEVLNINENDNILGITTGGDNILNYLVYNPNKIITCDFNCHQNYLLEMKMSAIQTLSQEEFYELFFNKNDKIWINNKLNLIQLLKTTDAKEFWLLNGDNIFKSFIYSGTCKYAKYLIKLLPSKLLNIFNINFSNLDEQIEYYDTIRPFLKNIIKIFDFILFKLNFVSLFGVPSEQVDTNHSFSCMDFIDFICRNTFLKDNYFYKAYINEKLDPDNLPDYCNKENYYDIRDRLHKIKIYTCTLEECLKNIPKNTITKASLLDHMDWMDDLEISKELSELKRVVKEDHIIIYRSFANNIPKKCLYKITNWSDDTFNSQLKNKDRLGTYLSLHTIKFDKKYIIPILDNSFCPPYNIYDELKIIYNMYFSQMKTHLDSHQERLDSFYKYQADYYDTYRKNMLHGRDNLILSIPFKYNDKWLDVGGGTGYSINLIEKYISNFEHIDIIEYSKSMFNVLNTNVKQYNNVNTHCIDFHKFDNNIKYDVITFSYSILMIPNIKDSIHKAISLLKPGGILAITDFYADNSLYGKFWKTVFKYDGVYLDENIDNYISQYDISKKINKVEEGGFPYVPFLKCKYFTSIYKLN